MTTVVLPGVLDADGETEMKTTDSTSHAPASAGLFVAESVHTENRTGLFEGGVPDE